MFSDITEELKAETLNIKDLENALKNKQSKIVSTIQEAFASEIKNFDWFTPEYIEDTVNTFVEELDHAFNSFRAEFKLLNEELLNIDVQIRSGSLNPKRRKTYTQRRESIENKLADMRSGNDEYSTYRYLSGYAPGNSVYYSGNRYLVQTSRIKTENNRPITSKLQICPSCMIAYLDDDSTFSGGACNNCGEDLTDIIPYEKAIKMPDQWAESRYGITSDEEERQRLGYDISPHYIMSKHLKQYNVVENGELLMTMRYDHKGRILEVNKGPTPALDVGIETKGFTLCTACSRWILSKNGIKEHLEDNVYKKCWRGATQDDIIENIVLYIDSMHDVLTIDCKLPEYLKIADYKSFYIMLSQAIMEGLQISMNVDEDELNSFLTPNPKNSDKSVIVIYEVDEGGAGILKSLEETATFRE